MLYIYITDGYCLMIIVIYLLVAGAGCAHFLKNMIMSESQWGWDDIPFL